MTYAPETSPEPQAYSPDNHEASEFRTATVLLLQIHLNEDGTPHVWQYPENRRIFRHRYGHGGIHATRNGRCAIVTAGVFWPWAYGLIDVPPPDADELSPHPSLIDFDSVDCTPTQRRVGFAAVAVGTDGTRAREITVSLDDFWDALVRLAEEPPR